jgi:calcineurin-like phosphoesterase family protein
MSETWFTSDLHLGHKNILEYEKEARPFNNLDEMHAAIIDRWNSVVNSKDVVYVVGDFAFGKHNIKIANSLNGKKKLVMGNHDTYPTADYLPYFDKLYGVIFWERCIISHVPVHNSGLGARWMLNVHGHLHSKRVKLKTTTMLHESGAHCWTLEDDPNYFNVSVEQNNLTPINADKIRERLKELKD